VKILFYGRLADAIGRELEVKASDGCTVAELRQTLAASHPEAAETLASRRARACVGDFVVAEDYVLAAADQVEFLPPVSGG